MRVELINAEQIKSLYENHGLFACGCYNTPDKYAEKVGESCQKSSHMSGSRCEYFKFRIYDVDRGTAEQCLRHEIGVRIPMEDQDNYLFGDSLDINPASIVKNMASFRYIDKKGFEYAIPENIKKTSAALHYYNDLMAEIETKRKLIKKCLEDAGVEPKKATEDANFVLPRATTTMLTIGFTPEALIGFMHKRLCTRAQDEIRAVAVAMKKEVAKIIPEWAAENLVANCKYLLWCPESEEMSCKAMPTKEKLKKELEKKTV